MENIIEPDKLSSQAVEIQIDILSRLGIYDLISVRSVSRTFYAIIDDPEFYNRWYPSGEGQLYLMKLSKIKHPHKSVGFSYFYLWFHKYVLYRYNCIRHSYGLMDMEICEPDNIYLMSMYKTYEYLEALSTHDDSPENYIQTVTELLIGFDIATPLESCDTALWELIYGYIKIHCKKHGGKSELINRFIEKFYTGSRVIVKFRNI